MQRLRLGFAMVIAILAMSAGSAFAQNQNNGQARGQGQGGGRGNFDPAQMRERMMSRIKEQLGATDEEWKAIEPKVDKVMTAQRESRGGFGFGGFGRGGPGGGGPGGGGGGGADQQPTTAVGKARRICARRWIVKMPRPRRLQRNGRLFARGARR